MSRDRTPPAAARVGAAALLVSSGTALGKLLGLARDVVLASVFGAGGGLDAFFVAQGVPTVAVGLVSSSTATAVVPAVSGLRARGRHDEAAQTFAGILNVTTLITAVASAVLAWSAPAVVSVVAPGFDEGRRALAVDLTRVVLVAAAFVGATNLVTAYLQASGRFLWPALGGLPFNVVMIAGVLAFGGGFGVEVVAYAFVAASLARLVLLAPGLRAAGFRVRLSTTRRDPRARGVWRLVPPLLVNHALSDVNAFVDRIVGSLAATGTISALNYAYRLVRVPHALLTLALVQALYPAVSAAIATEEPARVARLVDRALGALALVLVPVAAATVVFAEPVVAVVYERGAFGDDDARLTALALSGYAFGAVFLGMREILARVLYAHGDTRTPTLIAAGAMVVNVAGDVTLGRALGAFGLALTTTLAFLAGLVLTHAAVRRRTGYSPRGAARTLLQATAAALPAGGAAKLVHAWAVEGGPGADGFGAVVSLAVAAAAGSIVYVGGLKALRTLRRHARGPG